MSYNQYLSCALVSAVLAGCGGGGGNDSSGPDPEPTPTPTPTNSAPTISLSESSVTLDELTSLELELTTADADGDRLTLSLASDNAAITATAANNILTISAADVAEDVTTTVTVTVSDGTDTASVQLAVSVTDIPYTPFTMAWQQSETPHYQVTEADTAVIPINYTAGTSSADQLSISVSSSVDTEQSPTNFSASFNIEQQQLLVSPVGPISYVDSTNVELELSVSDNRTQITLPLMLDVAFANRSPWIDLPRQNYLEIGVVQEHIVSAPNAIEPNSVTIDVDQIELLEGDADLIEFAFDQQQQRLTVMAPEGSEQKLFSYRIYSSDSNRGLSGSIHSFYVKGATTEEERQVEQRAIEVAQLLHYSQEVERLADVILEALIIEQQITPQQVQREKRLLVDYRYELATEYPRTLNCIHQAAATGFVEQWNFFYQPTINEGFICTAEETPMHDGTTDGTAIAHHYSDANNRASALAELDRIASALNQDHSIHEGMSLFDHVNQLATQLNVHNENATIGMMAWAELLPLTNGGYSRYIGNNDYGSYQDSIWQWKPEYRWLELAYQLADEASSNIN